MVRIYKQKYVLWIGRKSRRVIINTKHQLLLRFIYPIIGLAALIWFLIRVIPKPSRATYPCQRAAFPIASSFVIYLMGLLGAAAIFRRAQHRIKQARYVLAAACMVVGMTVFFFTISSDPERVVAGEFIPADPPNTPIGQAKGLFPGRVVWLHDPNATSWDGVSNYWWDNDHTNPAVVESMMAKAVCWLTQQPEETSAWDSLFRQYNATHGKGNVGYSAGERVVIKPNHNNQLSHSNRGNSVPDTPPAVYVALLKQLVYKAGVDPNYITISESSRYIDDKTYNACFALFPEIRYEETNYYRPENNPGTNGRQQAEPVPNTIVWSSTHPNTGQSIANYPLAKAFVEADYVINLARMQGHGFAGATLCAKNWYGCFCLSPEYDSTLHSGNVLHDLVSSPQYDRYSPLVDLIGHKHLGDKAMLYVLDGLWGFEINYFGYPTQFTNAPFSGDYPSSIFVSQDPVAIDSVGLDFLAAQFDLKDVPIDSYLHEAALADNPPSGVVYDPEGDGSRLASLGVHEHWNNPLDKQYSRNLETGNGIELIYVSPTSSPIPDLLADVDNDGCVGILDLVKLSYAWNSNPSTGNWDIDCDIAPIGGDECIDLKDFSVISNQWNTVTTYALKADFNFDHKVFTNDLYELLSRWLTNPEQPGWVARYDVFPDGGDGVINNRDFSFFSQYWLEGVEFLPADLNRDLSVNIADLAIFSNAWLSTEEMENWCQECDLETEMTPGTINLADFSVFSDQWMGHVQ